MSESKAKLQEEVERLRRIACEASMLLEIADDLCGEAIEPRMLDGLSKVVRGHSFSGDQEGACNDSKDDLYERLASLSKALESSGRIDEHEYPDAYATILDAMNAARQQQGNAP
ncbi:MAG TPA: hypothetical protein VFF81_05605 [Noviherbaspirillum sp.]|nr:hypothetical protein [Noviherbaspirillum sp.]